MKLVRYNPQTGEKTEFDDGRPEPPVIEICPCCRYRTLTTRGGYDICPVCFWEDDGQDDADADTVRGGPNVLLSLTTARNNYQAFGACEQSMLPHVRPPRPSEIV